MTIDKLKLFELIYSQAVNVKGFNPSDDERELLELAFYGLFRKDGKGLLKSVPNWPGYVSIADNSIDRGKLLQCIRSAFCKLFLYHRGKFGSSIGTLISADCMLRYTSEDYLSDYKRIGGARFASLCDTFIQVFIYLASKGETSSIPGADWRRAFGYND